MPVIGTPVFTVSSGPVPTLSPTITQIYGQPILTRRQSITVVVGQNASINYTIRDQLGNPIDLTGYTGFTLTLRISEAVGNQNPASFTNITGTYIDAVNGVVGATLTPAVVAYAGISIAEFAILDVSGNVLFSNTFYLIVDYGQFGAAINRSGPPTLAEIRLHLRDSGPEDNFLIDTMEFDGAELAACITRPIDEFNSMPPPLNTQYNTSNFPYRSPWLDAICGHLFMMAAHHYRRNHLPYSAAGISIDDKNKEQNYMQAAMLFKQKWETWAKYKKVQLNMEAGIGDLLSGYSYYVWPNY